METRWIAIPLKELTEIAAVVRELNETTHNVIATSLSWDLDSIHARLYGLIEKCPEVPNPHDHWAEREAWPVDHWRAEVENDDTRLGYLAWVEQKQKDQA